jgi:hypothetical protein
VMARGALQLVPVQPPHEESHVLALHRPERDTRTPEGHDRRWAIWLSRGRGVIHPKRVPTHPAGEPHGL